MKKIVFSTIFLFSLAGADYVNGIIATVENQPITSYELNTVMKKMNIDNQKALNLLIRERLEDAQIVALNIVVNGFEVESKIEQLAKTNGMDAATFKEALDSKGIDYNAFKQDVEKNLKREKLYARILNNQSQNITPENAKKFYEANPGMFAQFDTINVARYSSDSRQNLETIIKSPMSMPSGVSIENLSLTSKNLNPQLRYIFINSKDKTFTPIFQIAANEFEMFYIISREGSYLPDFESVEQQVVNAMASQEQEIAVADYFNKLRVKANIEILKR
ncbi:SurA N-terminal domain-containing protein [Campylobacter hyointestinalis]|uniref:Iron receptor CfrA n=1 Tax=Campylobacter hyointestinalis subsp. lawsonii TaxID=91353 RepID=A0AAV6EE30_CAMHY|nr:SurA N-terminal domain-containing protein [Campylobacter hyointestinalis]KAB0611843.1 iron receptor CfrA [Campylobacter hyointestinalis subsp. lawsonii]QKF69016.1 putative chaperone (SurA domain) [Campylobacter hyointestinalis subsp. lawsonii]RAZ28797.1 iron receptor CfrA [Campylobacter hyointestinalis subsp. lawsonii]